MFDFIKQALAQMRWNLTRRAELILDALLDLTEQVKKMSGTLASLQAQVASNTTVIQSAIVLINGFSAELAAAGTDPVALQALQDSLAASDMSLAQAVAANTPAVPSGGSISGGADTTTGAATVAGSGDQPTVSGV